MSRNGVLLSFFLGFRMYGELSSNKRLMLNTVILYMRMIVVMGVSFYTTRVVLNVLGDIDYGLVNAIAGVVSMFGFISVSLSTACSRYFSFKLGRKDYVKLNQMFSLILFLYVCVAGILCLMSETVGLWYLRHKLVFPPDRANAVFWFFQCTVGTIIVGWLAVPYNSLAVAYENMALFSWLSIFDALIKLIVALLIRFATSYDALVGYGVLLFVGAMIHSFANYLAVRIKYPASRFKWYFDKAVFKNVCTFSGWNFFGVFVWMTSDTFVTLLLNSFFGPIVNAARAIAMQVMSGVSSFTVNFLTAARPQVVKAWAGGNRMEAWVLFKRVSKIGYFLMFVFILPLCFELPFVLSVWLGGVPDYTVMFTRLVLVTALINSFSHPAANLIQAIGRVGLFEGIGSGARVFIFPISYIFLYFGAAPDSVFYVTLVFTFICVCARVGILCKIGEMPIGDFLRDVMIRLLVATILCFLGVCGIHCLMVEGWLRLIVESLTSACLAVVFFYYIALNSQERESVVRSALGLYDKLHIRLSRGDI